MKSAFDTIKETYDIELLREIRDHGCVSGVAHDHIYYSDTLPFFDHFEDEIIEYIADTLGGEFNEELWNQNPCDLTGYKNDTVWCFIELVAGLLTDEYEDTTQEELSDSDGPKHIIDQSSGEVIFEGDPSYNELSTNTYEAVKELASTPWGQDHLEIISA